MYHINNFFFWKLEKNAVRRDLSKDKMESGKEFLSVRRRYEDNVDCEEFRIRLSPLFGFLSHAFLIVARHPYDLSSFEKMPIFHSIYACYKFNQIFYCHFPHWSRFCFHVLHRKYMYIYIFVQTKVPILFNQSSYTHVSLSICIPSNWEFNYRS